MDVWKGSAAIVEHAEVEGVVREDDGGSFFVKLFVHQENGPEWLFGGGGGWSGGCL